MRQSFNEVDKWQADEFRGVVGYTPELMCSANGCPNRWSVDPGRLCSAHAWADPVRWPEITQQEQWSETDSVIANGRERSSAPTLTRADKQEILGRLRGMVRGIGGSENPRAWAERLREREESGERLGDVQRHAWRDALRVDFVEADA